MVRILLVALLTLAACQPAPPPATPAPTAAVGIGAFVDALVAAGVPARIGGTFSTEPVGGAGTIVCLGTETVNVYEFPTAAARESAASRIDPHDPSKVGNAIIEWVGTPHFWQRDRLLVLYVGSGAAAIGALNGVLGPPFAAGPPFAGSQVRSCS